MSVPTRRERDGLGDVDVPADALYGSQTVRALENLSFSHRRLSHYPAYLRALAWVKQAAARANRVAGILDQRSADAIEAACQQIIAGHHLDQFPVDLLAGGGSIAVNMNANEVLANLANEALGGRRGHYQPLHPKTHVNASQSTADVCHTATRLALLAQWPSLHAALADAIHALTAKATELRPVTTISRTCLQAGLPTSLGDLFGGYTALLQRRTAALEDRVHAMRQINLGGTVIGSGDGAPAAYRAAIVPELRQITGLDVRLRDNLYDAAQNIDDLADVSAQLALLAQALIKLAQDLRLLSSDPASGFGELILPTVQEGSSFFAGKINPVVPETVIQCALQVVGCDRVVQGALEHGELNLNVFEGLAAANLFDAVAMLSGVIPLFTHRCLIGITANVARCQDLATGARSGS